MIPGERVASPPDHVAAQMPEHVGHPVWTGFWRLDRLIVQQAAATP
jgi:hypothetical protein